MRTPDPEWVAYLEAIQTKSARLSLKVILTGEAIALLWAGWGLSLGQTNWFVPWVGVNLVLVMAVGLLQAAQTSRENRLELLIRYGQLVHLGFRVHWFQEDDPQLLGEFAGYQICIRNQVIRPTAYSYVYRELKPIAK